MEVLSCYSSKDGLFSFSFSFFLGGCCFPEPKNKEWGFCLLLHPQMSDEDDLSFAGEQGKMSSMVATNIKWDQVSQQRHLGEKNVQKP